MIVEPKNNKKKNSYNSSFLMQEERRSGGWDDDDDEDVGVGTWKRVLSRKNYKLIRKCAQILSKHRSTCTVVQYTVKVSDENCNTTKQVWTINGHLICRAGGVNKKHQNQQSTQEAHV
jgi:hypothetical protein